MSGQQASRDINLHPQKHSCAPGTVLASNDRDDQFKVTVLKGPTAGSKSPKDTSHLCAGLAKFCGDYGVRAFRRGI